MSEVETIWRFDREDFLDHYWDYRPGQHVSLIGATDSGKTTLSYQLLQKSATPELPAIVLVMKPRDATVEKWDKVLKFRRVRHWPPTPSLWQPRKPPGWTLWPMHSFDPDVDNERMRGIFRTAILDSYRKGNRILFADEVYGLVHELGLQTECVAVWTRGRSMGTGMWAATQKPSHVPLWMYNQAQHLFLAYEADKRARQRFGEIGGVDPKLVEELVLSLDKWEWLYIGRGDKGGPVMCIISA